MECTDIERIARMIVREYGLPLRFESLRFDGADECVLRFAAAFLPTAAMTVAVRCPVRASPYLIRESLKRGLEVSD